MASKPFIDEFFGHNEFTSTEFIEIFRRYDSDGNNYIEAKELDGFLKDLFRQKYGKNYSSGKVSQLKDYILQKYDKNHDNRLDMNELAEILPTEENFLVKLRNPSKPRACKTDPMKLMTSVEFMKIWNHYDPNREGVLGKKELRGFVVDIMGFKGHRVDPDSREPDRGVEELLKCCDKDDSGEVDLAEITGYLNVEENYLKPFKIKAGQKLKPKEFSEIWYHYDKDRSGEIAGAELDALIRDLYTKIKGKTPEMKDINDWRDMIMRFTDRDGDDSVSKEEMDVFFSEGLSQALKRLK